MAYKDDKYTVEAFDMQGKVDSKETYNTRSIAEIHGAMCLKKQKIKLVRINGRIWRKKSRK